jgi:5-methylcytosine-specific restriction endonuclease McrA
VRFECLYCSRHQSVLDHVVLEDLERLDHLSGAHLVDLFLDHFT